MKASDRALRSLCQLTDILITWWRVGTCDVEWCPWHCCTCSRREWCGLLTGSAHVIGGDDLNNRQKNWEPSRDAWQMWTLKLFGTRDIGLYYLIFGLLRMTSLRNLTRTSASLCCIAWGFFYEKAIIFLYDYMAPSMVTATRGFWPRYGVLLRQ